MEEDGRATASSWFELVCELHGECKLKEARTLWEEMKNGRWSDEFASRLERAKEADEYEEIDSSNEAEGVEEEPPKPTVGLKEQHIDFEPFGPWTIEEMKILSDEVKEHGAVVVSKRAWGKGGRMKNLSEALPTRNRKAIVRGLKKLEAEGGFHVFSRRTSTLSQQELEIFDKEAPLGALSGTDDRWIHLRDLLGVRSHDLQDLLRERRPEDFTSSSTSRAAPPQSSTPSSSAFAPSKVVEPATSWTVAERKILLQLVKIVSAHHCPPPSHVSQRDWKQVAGGFESKKSWKDCKGEYEAGWSDIDGGHYSTASPPPTLPTAPRSRGAPPQHLPSFPSATSSNPHSFKRSKRQSEFSTDGSRKRQRSNLRRWVDDDRVPTSSSTSQPESPERHEPTYPAIVPYYHYSATTPSSRPNSPANSRTLLAPQTAPSNSLPPSASSINSTFIESYDQRYDERPYKDPQGTQGASLGRSDDDPFNRWRTNDEEEELYELFDEGIARSSGSSSFHGSSDSTDQPTRT
ncbi:hypothetical protein RQP46_005860 [Phenoliferia psychrophenolica]